MAPRLLLRGSSVFRRPDMCTAFLVSCLYASRCVPRSIWWTRVDVPIYNIHIHTFHFTPTDVTCRKTELQLEYPVCFIHITSSSSWTPYLHCKFSAELSRTALDYLTLVSMARRKWKCVSSSKQEQKLSTNRNGHTHRHTQCSYFLAQKPDGTSSKPAWGQEWPWV